MKNKTLSIFKIITLAIILTTGLSFVYANWSPPLYDNPPNGGSIPEPINSSSEDQRIYGTFNASRGIVVGQITGGINCVAEQSGSIRWNPSHMTEGTPPVLSPSLESCNGTKWKQLPQADNACELRQEVRSCTGIQTYECNCGKESCSTCTVSTPGHQYQVLFTCATGDTGVAVRTGWSNCQ